MQITSAATTIESIPTKSIAVLPFVNISKDPEQEYISEGIAEEILNVLSNVKDLKVAGRSSSFRLDSESIDLRDIGEKLGVSTVLEGSVRKHENRIRVSVQLINVDDGFQLWAEKFDREMGDIFAIQDEIAQKITEKLKVTFQDDDPGQRSKNRTPSMDAYELYLKGRYHINKRGPSIVTGMQYFQLAVEADPDYALAHAGYADANLMCAFYGLLPPLQAMQDAKASADIALHLDPTLCEPYCSLAYYYASCEWDWQESEKYFLRAIEINPRYTQAHLWYGMVLLSWVRGDFEKAEKHAKLALQADPENSICCALYGSILHTAGKFREALEICQRGKALDPNSFLSRIFEAHAFAGLKMYPEAIKAYEEIMTIYNKHHFALASLVRVYTMTGKLNKASVLAYDMKERYAKQQVGNIFAALTIAYTDNDTAMEFLEKAFHEREPFLLTLKHEHWVAEGLREDPRFQDLLERIGFPKGK